MSRRLTTDEFIEKAKAFHEDRYDYSSVNYVGAHTKVTIKCLDHGPFEQKPTNHLSGTGCPDCWGEKKQSLGMLKTARDAAKCFVTKARKVHGKKYSYDSVDYVNSQSKVIIRCAEHGDFEQSPNAHLRGSGCPDCGNARTAQKKRKSFEDFVEQANEIHGDRYQYHESAYKDSHEDTRINCPDHGDFNQQPANHLSGQGCPNCGVMKRGQSKNARWLAGLTKKFREVHGDQYDYSQAKAVDSVTPINVVCRRHGVFPVRPSNHLTGHGCPLCARENSPQFIDARIKNDEDYAGRPGILYLLQVNHPQAPSTFYKIGITSLGGLDQRFGNRSLYSGFDFELIDKREGTMREMWSLERQIKARIRSEDVRVTRFCDDFWHWTESFHWPHEPNLKGLLHGE
jgi:hypothetical protein